MLQPGIYRHFKGKKYQVIGTAIHSETQEKYVVYREHSGFKKLWIRPLAMFQEKINKDGRQMSRFILIDAKDKRG